MDMFLGNVKIETGKEVQLLQWLMTLMTSRLYHNKMGKIVTIYCTNTSFPSKGKHFGDREK